MYTKIKSLLRPIWNVRPILYFWRSAFMYQMRGVLFQTLEKINGYKKEKATFRERVGYEPNLRNPRSLNEKIVWKKLHDRNPLLSKTADKYLVRDFIQEVLGKDGAHKILTPLLYVTDVPEEIPFHSFPDEYVIKSNHAGGQVIIVTKDTPIDKAETIKTLKEWLKYPYSFFEHEWCYWPIKRKIIVEELLRDADGDLAQDYKLHVFHGKCKFIHITPKKNALRSGVRSLFTPDWDLMPVGWYYKEYVPVNRPEGLKNMVEIAEKLAAPFEYARVDLYNREGRINFGEITHYHGVGWEPFHPESFDFEFGKYWHIVPQYWKLDTYAAKQIH